MDEQQGQQFPQSEQPYQQPQPQQPYQQPYQPPEPPQQAVYAKSCMGAAWSDITQSEGWVSRMLLLGLINIVPIFNFVVQGYAMQWARDLVVGKIEQLPKKIVSGKNFEFGFYAFIVALIFGIISAIAGSILGFIPFLGSLVLICLSFFLLLFQVLMVLRCAVGENFSAAFQLGKVWDAFKPRFWTLLGAAALPTIIIDAIVIAISCVIMLIFMGPILVNLISLAEMSSAGYVYSSTFGASIFSIIFSIIPMILLVLALSLFASGIQSVWVYRSVAHYVARYCPEWASDPQLHYNNM